MVPRLAFNAEAWLAEHFNAYLTDADEYRAITRHLLHQGGVVDYTSNQIIVISTGRTVPASAAR